MANNAGVALLDFGSSPNSRATYTVPGQTGITTDSLVEPWIPAVASSNNNADNHKLMAAFIGVTAGSIVAGTSFVITAISSEPVTGIFTVNWCWSTPP